MEAMIPSHASILSILECVIFALSLSPYTIATLSFTLNHAFDLLLHRTYLTDTLMLYFLPDFHGCLTSFTFIRCAHYLTAAYYTMWLKTSGLSIRLFPLIHWIIVDFRQLALLSRQSRTFRCLFLSNKSTLTLDYYLRNPAARFVLLSFIILG